MNNRVGKFAHSIPSVGSSNRVVKSRAMNDPVPSVELVLPPELEGNRAALALRASQIIRDHMRWLRWEHYLPLFRMRFEVTASVPFEYRWGLVDDAGAIITVKEGAAVSVSEFLHEGRRENP